MRIRITLAFLLPAILPARGAIVDTLSLESAVLGRSVSYTVIRPSHYGASVQDGRAFPVVYLLHCAGCDHLSWLQSDYCEGMAEEIDSVHLIAVAPFDGTSASWWLDSPLRPESRMSTFLVDELKPHIDTTYATCAGRENTAVAGHSMGGFGALHNAMYYPQTFGVAVGIKSGVDLLNPDWPSDFGLEYVLGDRVSNRANWEWATVSGNAGMFVGTDVRIRLYCGLQDTWFGDENRALHHTFDSLGVEHDYIELDQSHFRITRDVVRTTLRYCDTVFTSCPGSPARHGRTVPRGEGGQRIRPAGAPGGMRQRFPDGLAVFSIRGQAVRPGPSRALPQGIYIALLPGGAACVPLLF